jgi:hypothetical protein
MLLEEALENVHGFEFRDFAPVISTPVISPKIPSNGNKRGISAAHVVREALAKAPA